MHSYKKRTRPFGPALDVLAFLEILAFLVYLATVDFFLCRLWDDDGVDGVDVFGEW